MPPAAPAPGSPDLLAERLLDAVGVAGQGWRPAAPPSWGRPFCGPNTAEAFRTAERIVHVAGHLDVEPACGEIQSAQVYGRQLGQTGATPTPMAEPSSLEQLAAEGSDHAGAAVVAALAADAEDGGVTPSPAPPG